MPSKHHAKRHHSKGANNKRTVKKNTRRHRRSHKKQTGGSPASRSVMDFVNTSGPALDDYTAGMELPSMDKITKCATQQMGGSLVSDTVMEAQTGMNDYQSQANLPAMSQLGGGSCGGNPKQAGGTPNNKNYQNTTPENQNKTNKNNNKQIGGTNCSANPKQLGGDLVSRNSEQSDYIIIKNVRDSIKNINVSESNKNKSVNKSTKNKIGGAGSCGSPTSQNLLGNGNLVAQKGGSPASDRLNTFTEVHNTYTLNEQKGDVITPDMISGGAEPNLYQLTGGRGRKGRRGTKKQKFLSKQRGGNFLGLAGCGPWNGTDAGRKYADFFTKTSKCPGPEWYANPPELPKAGSGDAVDLAVGATYPFA